MEMTLNERIENDLRENILIKTYKDLKIPPERDLALKYKVSRITVRTALKNLEAEGLIHRIQGKGTFVKDETNEINGKTKSIGMLLSDRISVTNPYFAQLFKGIYEYNKNTRFNIKFVYFKEEEIRDKKTDWIKRIEEKGINYILSPIPVPEKVIEQLCARGIMTVTLNFVYSSGKVNAVRYNQKRGCYLSTEHLIKRGCRKVGLILGVANEEFGVVKISSLILEGYREALKKYKLPFVSCLVKEGEWDRASLESEVEDLLENKVDAISCVSEAVLSKVISVLTKKNIKVPEDIALTTFCFAENMYPFTTVAISPAQIAVSAMNLVYNLSKNGKTPVQQIIDKIHSGNSYLRR